MAIYTLRTSPFRHRAVSVFECSRKGITNWGQLFNVRQKLGLLILAREIASRAGTDEPVGHFLALCLGKTADLCNSGTRWKPGAECPVGLFSSPKLPPIWDWAEAVLTSESSGSFYSACERTAHTIEASLSFDFLAGTALVADAAKIPLPTEEAEVWFTDPLLQRHTVCHSFRFLFRLAQESPA